MRLGVAAALVGTRLVPGDVEVSEGRVEALGMTPAGRSGTALPGLVDLQVNGFAGVDFLRADPQGYERAGAALAARGVTSYLATLISSPPEELRRALKVASGLPEHPGGPRLLGVHLEGPFISPRWPGAHDPAHILDPQTALATDLCAAGPVRMVTLAPERPGALDLLRALRRRGVTVSVGHTDADADAAHAAFDAGAAAITHVFNAHRRFAARDPGPAGAALARDDTVVQAIADLVHLAPETLLLAARAARGRFSLVSDAMAAAGLGAGTYPLGGREVTVTGRTARLPDGTLAGSVTSLDAGLRNLVSLGIPLEEAAASASQVPARLIGHPELGVLAEGAPADVVVLDSSLEVVRTLVAGEEVFRA